MCRKIGFCSLLFLILINCNYRQKKIASEDTKEEIVFKNWLKDTLSILKRENVISYTKAYSLTKDSLSLNITRTFNEKLNPKKIDTIKSKDLLYALGLLNRNNYIPKNEFKLHFVITSYYTVSMVPQLKYEVENEINAFDVINKNNIEKYNFIKGNFIDRKIINN